MGFFKIKLRPSDRLWTKYIRIRDNFTCQKCGRQYAEDNCRNLGVSHYYGRGNENTRFDDDNCIALCTLPCHQRWGEQDRAEYTEFMKQRLGEDGFRNLEIKKNIRKDRDDKADRLYLKQLLEGEK